METEAQFEPDPDPNELEHIPCQGGSLELETITRPVTAIMRTEIGTVAPHATVQEAVELMASGHYGCVLVVEGPRLVGILSERDVVVRLLDRSLDPRTEKVADHMTMEPETVSPADAIAFALNIMSVGGFRHVPVTDDTGALAGIVSIRDVAHLLVEHFRAEILTLPPRTDPGPRTQHGG